MFEYNKDQFGCYGAIRRLYYIMDKMNLSRPTIYFVCHVGQSLQKSKLNIYVTICNVTNNIIIAMIASNILIRLSKDIYT